MSDIIKQLPKSEEAVQSFFTSIGVKKYIITRSTTKERQFCLYEIKANGFERLAKSDSPLNFADKIIIETEILKEE